MLKPIPEIDLNKCDGCGVCAENCPSGAAAIIDGKVVMIHPEDCTYCTDCEGRCPVGAISCPYEIVLSE